MGMSNHAQFAEMRATVLNACAKLKPGAAISMDWQINVQSNDCLPRVSKKYRNMSIVGQ
jgi:hypothetical protein